MCKFFLGPDTIVRESTREDVCAMGGSHFFCHPVESS